MALLKEEKLHLAINDRGELLNIALTACNVDDRKPVQELLQGQSGKFFPDKGYISKALANSLRDSGIVLITKFKLTSFIMLFVLLLMR